MGRGLLGACLVACASACDLVFPVEPGKQRNGDAPTAPGADAPGGGLPDSTDRDYLFEDGFETGLTPWTLAIESGDVVATSASEVNSGSFSARCNTDATAAGQAAVYVDLQAMGQVHGRAYVRLGDPFNPSDYVGLIQLVNYSGSWRNLATWIVEPDRSLYVLNNFTNGEYFADDAFRLVPGQWHRIDFAVMLGPTGWVSLALDGRPLVSVSNLDLGILQANRLVVGNVGQGNGADSLSLHVDDIAVDPAPL